MTGTVLILGATGRFGRNAAEAFAAKGWTVRGFDRKRDDLMQSARGADVIVNAWNPTYDKWAKEVPGLTARVIEAAKASGATVIVPGNVYVYGSPLPEVLGPDTPHMAANPLGRIRREMEGAYRVSGVQTIILRAGDYIDTEASGNWFDSIMVKSLAKGTFTYPGRGDVPHAFAYLPDLARATVALAKKRGELGQFEDIGFAGYTVTGQGLDDGIAHATGRDVRLKRFNWLPLFALAPVWRMARHLVEMRYLWREAHRVDGTQFEALVPGFETTPLHAALARAVEHQVHPDEAVAGGAVAVGAN